MRPDAHSPPRPSSPHASPVLDVFVDGGVVEIYFKGEVLTKLYSSATATGPNVTVTAVGGDAAVDMEAWQMDDTAITGGPAPAPAPALAMP